MQSGSNDVLTPWTSSRVLRILEAASASLASSRGGADGAYSGAVGDAAMAMDSLLRLSNQQPEVAGRVMVAPLFAQRPLVEPTTPASMMTSSSSPSTLCYSDAHRMCVHTLELCCPGWMDSASAQRKAKGDKHLARAVSPSSPAAVIANAPPCTTATELEEVVFAAEFAEPCLRGVFPDIALVARHGLPVGCAALLDCTVDGGGGVLGRRQAKKSNVAHHVLQSILQEPAVSHRKPPENDDASRAASPFHLRLSLKSTATAESSSALLWTSLPPPSAVPLEAYGPPSHKIFDQTAVAHTFTDAEVADLHAHLRVKSRPFQVYSKDEVRARREQAGHHQRRNAMLSAGVGAAPIVGPHGTTAAQKSGKHASRIADGEQDGWSASSDWSSSSNKGSDAEDDSGYRKESKGAVRGNNGTTTWPRLTAAEEEPPVVTRPLPNRTWVEDDGDIVLENGKVTIRKRKIRTPKNPPPLLPLPTMVSGPVLKPPQQAATLSDAAVAVAKKEEGRNEPPQSDGDGHPTDERKAESTNGETEEGKGEEDEGEETAPSRKRGAGVKRGRAADNAGDQSAPPNGGRSRKRAAHTSAKKSSSKRSGSVYAKSSPPPTLDTTNVRRLSKSEMLCFVRRLSVSDVLRRALLVGVQSPPVASTDAADDDEEKQHTESEEGNTNSGASGE
jgi:hypothetical protein